MTINSASTRQHKSRIIKKTRILFVLSTVLLSACSSIDSIEEQVTTLHSIDVKNQKSTNVSVFVKPKSDKEIRQAYTEYIKNTTKEDNARLAAISRLAELEFELSNQILKENQSSDENDEYVKNTHLKATLNKTIDLLTTSLEDYPTAQGNDRILYQLAKAYEQNGFYTQSINTLEELVSHYPKSAYYVESQFRLAEYNFISKDYTSAEDAYTEVIISPKNDIFYEKSLFKRGWSRYKQQLYLDAINDYLAAVTYHDFDHYNRLKNAEKDQFKEYFRAIGLAFSYLGNTDILNDYFANKTDFKYVYHTYSTISDIYLKQERYSDAADTLVQFIKYYPKSEYISHSQLKIIKIWETSGFNHNLYNAIESFYVAYNPLSDYWKTTNNTNTNNDIGKSLKKYIVLISASFHDKYQKNSREHDFISAKRWYERYLRHYSSYARKDNIFYLYAELLNQAKQYKTSFSYFEKAAYDGEIILDKKAAYATVLLSDHLYNDSISNEKQTWLEKHLQYATWFCQLYPNDKRSMSISVHAAELAFINKQYHKAIELAELLSSTANGELTYEADIIRAQSYFNLNQFENAQFIYSTILSSNKLSSEHQKELQNALALSIYRKAEQAKNTGDINTANKEFMHIATVAPTSDIAATGIYDAIALSMSNNLWSNAINYIKIFQRLYPRHKYNKDITKKLSLAYLNSDQNINAAKTLEKMSFHESDKKIKTAALWQSAKLYESQKDWTSAIRTYREYANTYKEPFPEYMESMYKLIQLYNRTNNNKSDFWKNKIYLVDRQTVKSKKTDRTKYIAATTILSLAKEKHQVFRHCKLIEPLRENLRKKKKTMQNAVKLYGQASAYGISSTTTEATYFIADIYQEFSQALIASERPKSLSTQELEQYEILLEDQAFPFEEKAIEFHEANLSHIKDGVHTEWITKSYTKLETLFPVRYSRRGRIEAFMSEIH